MARSWHYPRWRRIAMQAVLWAVFAATLAIAGLTVRHQHMADAVTLHDPIYADLPHGGPHVGVRLPDLWVLQHDPGVHDDGGQPVRQFLALESHGTGGADDDPAGAVATVDGRQLSVTVAVLDPSEPVPTAASYLEDEVLPAAARVVDEMASGRHLATSGRTPIAGVDGVWRAVAWPAPPPVPGLSREFDPAFVAVGIVRSVAGVAGPVAVTVVLRCHGPTPDPDAEVDVLRRVAAAVTVDPLVPPTVRPPILVPSR